jgi:4-alpha-glucanotransferase
MFRRSSGLLCHVTSLPGPHGIGDLGPAAYTFVDTLEEAHQHIWQVLPLGPAGGGDSPYDSRSSFAGNPQMISMEAVRDMGLLESREVPEETGFSRERVEFRRVQRWKGRRLRKAFEQFEAGNLRQIMQDFESFQQRNRDWLEDYALYQVLREAHKGTAWHRWPAGLRDRRADALSEARNELDVEVRFHEFVQFLFDEQWHRLKQHANDQGISIMGDIPIYVALDSADVWANQDQFLLDDQGKPIVQAGVPPDMFSADGQLWGNPVYDWEKMQADDFAWWTMRIKRVLDLTDIVRIDHFRGFAAGWQVPQSERTARNGEWVQGPGEAFFWNLQQKLGTLPIVVEDLGVITPDVEALRDGLGYPGMKVLQFAFGDDSENPYLPHNAVPNSMIYTGTHDNDTTRGWYQAASRTEQDHVREYLQTSSKRIHEDMIRAAWASVSVLACTPVQDLLDLGSEARMNVPGQAKGNWAWRLESIESLRERASFVRDLTSLYGRNRRPLGDS